MHNLLSRIEIAKELNDPHPLVEKTKRFYERNVLREVEDPFPAAQRHRDRISYSLGTICRRYDAELDSIFQMLLVSQVYFRYQLSVDLEAKKAYNVNPSHLISFFSDFFFTRKFYIETGLAPRRAL
jgi:hypothetical protein